MAPKDTKDAVDLTAESDKKKDVKKKVDDETPDAMSEEDQELKERLETCVSTVIDADNEAAVTIPIRQKALDIIVTELRTATASMTSVPKPLKFLRPHYAVLKKLHIALEKISSPDNATLEFRARLADVLSVLAMTMGNPGKESFSGLLRPNMVNLESCLTCYVCIDAVYLQENASRSISSCLE